MSSNQIGNCKMKTFTRICWLWSWSVFFYYKTPKRQVSVTSILLSVSRRIPKTGDVTYRNETAFDGVKDSSLDVQGRKKEEADEFNFHVARHRPEELAKLIKTTKFTRKEIQLIYRGFKQECPTGMVDEDSFKHIFAQFFPQGDATHYAHYVFNTIKHNQTGKISFEDFLDILSKVSRGSIQEKLQWIFGLYDLNGDGLITKNEMLDVVTSIYEMLGRYTEPQVEENSAKEHVEKLFHQIDTNKDGVVTIDELVEWCSRDERILQSLETLDTVL